MSSILYSTAVEGYAARKAKRAYVSQPRHVVLLRMSIENGALYKFLTIAHFAFYVLFSDENR